MKNINNYVIGISIVVGLLALGLCINKGLQSFSTKERVVTVKGLAEQNIKAIEATINVGVSFSGDIPKDLVEAVNFNIEKISKYLKENGYSDFSINDITIYDSGSYYEDKWNGNSYVKVKKDRYKASKTIAITLKDVEKASSISNKISIDLIGKDIVCSVSCSYSFPELNNIKPKLIEESTKNARISGEQFANDSKSKLGKIKTASQGQISIAGQYYDEDSPTSAPKEPYIQKVRVVSTIVFFLED